MTTDHTQTADAAPVRSARTEKRFAAAEIAAPLVTAGLMPFLANDAATTVSVFLAAPAVVAAANFTGLISDRVLADIPGGDILRAHRVPFMTSMTATAVAAATETMQGPDGIASLVTGWMEMPTLPGIVSLAWWAAAGYVAYSLRRVLRRHPAPLTAPQAAAGQDDPGNQTVPHADILQPWADYIAAERGTNPGQHLHLTARGPEAWAGEIHSSAPGKPVSVTRETVSGVYQLPVDWIHIAEGPHGSTKTITVRLVPPTVDDAQHHALAAMWLKRVARKGGLMPGTHLEEVTADPNTGGLAAWVVADDETDAITIPDRYLLAGALRTRLLLVSLEPTDDPRRAAVRVMGRSPLEDGKALPGLDMLRANKNGFVQLGTGVSGRPARILLYDEGGARHVLVAGVTGSGKGGVLQLLALSYHANGVAIIYADPKGSSNPDVEDMAAYAGCGPEEALGALRVAFAVFRHRVAESRGLRAKNFVGSPDRPFVALILDEMTQLLGEKSPYRVEAGYIVSVLAAQGRSMGVCVVLCGQIMNLAQMGSDTSIRDNVFYGGALVLLRSDSDQKNRVDLPDSFAGADPSKIPAYWKASDDNLVYDPDVPEDDPRRTFGIGYVVGPDERAEMMRAWILESAAGLWDPENVAIPADFPDWADRDRIAAASTIGDDSDEEEDGAAWMPAQSVPAMTKEPTAREKILQVLAEFADPIGVDVAYLHIDQIVQMSGVPESTAANECSKLVKAGKAVRGAKGEYGIPVAPAAD
jgi:hypothetical protein